MTRDYRKVHVHKVPSIMTDDRMHDKLLIHFLRPRNGGGEVLELLYPTEYAGVAIVTFELEEVADRILRRTHSLELDSKRYPLELRRDVETTFKTQEDYMTIRTKLDFQLFPEKNAVKMLVEKCGLRVCSEMYDAMEIEGVFPALAKLKNELLNVLSDRESLQPSPRSTYSGTLVKQNSITSEMAVHRRAQWENEKRSAPQGLDQYPVGNYCIGTLKLNESPINNCSYDYRVSHIARHGDSLSLPVPVQGYRVTAGSEHATDAADQVPMLHEKQFDNFPLTQNSESNQRPKSNSFEHYSPSSTVHSKNPLSDESFLVSVEIPILQRQGRVSDCITVDKDTMKYIEAFKKEEFDMVLNSPPVEISSVDQGELSLITLSSNCATSSEMENVLRKFRNLLSITELGLRTQDVFFSGLSPEKMLLIIERSKELANKYSSVAVSCNDRLHLIGPSRKVFLLKQTLTDGVSLLGESHKEHLAGMRGRRDRSCPASREKRTAASNYAIGDTHRDPAVQSRARGHEIAEKRISQSSTDMEAHKNKRLQRGNSLERATYREARRAQEVGQVSDLSSLNTGERGREKSKNLIKRSLGKFDHDKFKEKLKLAR